MVSIEAEVVCECGTLMENEISANIKNKPHDTIINARIIGQVKLKCVNCGRIVTLRYTITDA